MDSANGPNSFWLNLHIPRTGNPLESALRRDRAVIKLFPICSKLNQRYKRSGLMLCITVRKKEKYVLLVLHLQFQAYFSITH